MSSGLLLASKSSVAVTAVKRRSLVATKLASAVVEDLDSIITDQVTTSSWVDPMDFASLAVLVEASSLVGPSLLADHY